MKHNTPWRGLNYIQNDMYNKLLIFESHSHHVRCIVERFDQHFSKIKLTLATKRKIENVINCIYPGKFYRIKKKKKGKKRKCIIEGVLEPASQTWIFSDAYNQVKSDISL